MNSIIIHLEDKIQHLQISSSTCAEEEIKKKQWDVFRTMLETASVEEAIRSNKENQALLLACKYEAPLDIIEKLVQIKPELIQANDEESHQTPLHILCHKPASHDRNMAIVLLIQQYPQAVIIMDPKGNTPLHVLCRNPCDSAFAVSAIEAVSLAGPAAMIMENHYDETPMEIFLLSRNASISLYEEEYQNKGLKSLCRTNILHLSNFRSSSRGEMYRLQCCQQAMFEKKKSSLRRVCSMVSDEDIVTEKSI